MKIIIEADDIYELKGLLENLCKENKVEEKNDVFVDDIGVLALPTRIESSLRRYGIISVEQLKRLNHRQPVVVFDRRSERKFTIDSIKEIGKVFTNCGKYTVNLIETAIREKV